jgi:dTDP-4-dehydrorhamnose reductase
MRVLITGGSGLLGKSLLETKPDDIEVALTWNKNITGVADTLNLWYKLDIKNRSDVFEVFEVFKPNIVIHCASIGSVDYTESHYQEVRDVNVGGLNNVIDAANGYKSRLIYISSNAVFSGKTPPYDEKSPLEPTNAYGVIKREAEGLIRSNAEKWLIFRPFMLYGWPWLGGRINWAVKVIGELQLNRMLKLVDDVTWMPTYAPDCASVIWKLLFQKELDKEIFNVASPERATLYQFGLKVCEVFSLEKNLLKPVNSDFFSIGQGAVKAKRPKDTTYDLIKLSRYGFMLSDIRTGLEDMREAENA